MGRRDRDGWARPWSGEQALGLSGTAVGDSEDHRGQGAVGIFRFVRRVVDNGLVGREAREGIGIAVLTTRAMVHHKLIRLKGQSEIVQAR